MGKEDVVGEEDVVGKDVVGEDVVGKDVVGEVEHKLELASHSVLLQ